MNSKKFFNIIISLLKSIDDNTNELKFEETFVVESDSPVGIPADIYKKICKELHSNKIDFMGIT